MAATQEDLVQQMPLTAYDMRLAAARPGDAGL